MRTLSLCAVAILAALLCFVSSASAQQYTVNDLGNLTGFPITSARAINNNGQVVGNAITSDFLTTHPFRTAPNSPITDADDLGVLSGASASANGINNSGQVVGNSNNHAFRADPGNPTLVDLGIRSGTLSGLASSNANGINDSGQVTGAATAATTAGAPCFGAFSSRAYRTIANGPVSTSDDLGTLYLTNCRSSNGFAINGSGQVVGNSHFGNVFVASPATHAFLASPSSAMQDLGTLPGDTASNAASINDAGQIVGDSAVGFNLFGFPTHAFLKDGNNALQPLGFLGGTSSSARDINNVGQIVGSSTTTGDLALHAFIYENGVMTDLNDLIPANSGWVLQNASAINDVGQIIGSGTLNGVSAAFRLDPGGSAGVNILISQISGSVLGLSGGEVSSLGASLQSVLASIQRGNPHSAGGQLGAFVNKVNALVHSGRLSAEGAASLIAEANNINSSL